MPALITCWAVLRAPAGKLLAPMMSTLVPLLRRDKELEISDTQADLLMRMSAATIDRKLAPERAKLTIRGRSHTKPGSLLKSQIPIRTWAEWDDAVPGFVETSGHVQADPGPHRGTGSTLAGQETSRPETRSQQGLERLRPAEICK
jgi:hypothetical protein